MTVPDVQVGPEGFILVNGKDAIELGQCRRISYGTGDFIIKVDRFRDEARKEIELWDRLDEEDRQHFVPILCGSIDEGWVCQEYLKIKYPTPADGIFWQQIIGPLCKKYGLRDITNLWNWGLVDGVPMIYDYGE